MENAQTILVIFLSTALFIFLVLGIILISICIKIANHVKAISAKAENIADKAEDMAEFISSAAGPMALGRIISQVTSIFKGSNNKK